MFGVWIGPWMGMESAIIVLSFLLIAQDFIGLLDPDEFVGIGGVLGKIGMILLGQFVVTILNLLLGGLHFHPEGLIMAEKSPQAEQHPCGTLFLS